MASRGRHRGDGRPRRPMSGTPPKRRRAPTGTAAGRHGRSARRMRVGLPLAAIATIGLSGATLAIASSHMEKEQAGYSGPAAARCVPAELNASALLPGTGITVSPLPNSYDASPDAQISLLGLPARDITDVDVSGSYTGAHGGRLLAYSQGDGASFVPDSPFRPGETVTVDGQVDTPSGRRHFNFRFTVAFADPVPALPPGSKLALTPGEYQSFHSAPQVHPPNIDVTYSDSAKDGPGDILSTPYTGPGNAGPMIFEPDGQVVWMDPLPENVYSSNLQVQHLDGEPVLTWWQGYIPKNGFGMGEEVVDNSAYQTIMHVHPGNGFKADLHDFHILANDRAVVTVFNTIHCNLTSDGGPRDGDLTDSLFQELDLRTGLVRRQWDSVDHVPLTASYAGSGEADAEWPFDYFHLNTVDVRSNGTTLLSARNTWQLYLIDDRTGQITTSIGGRHPSVRMEPGTMTAFQHDASTLPDGDISIFDNGGTPFEHPQSRGLVISLDTQSNTVSEVTELVHPRALQAGSQGNVQELAGGNWFVGWGAEPYYTEFGPGGEMIYDAHLPLQKIVTEHGEHIQSYRAYKSEWRGTPTYPPSIAAEASGGGDMVYASWNGSTEVTGWQVLGGGSPDTLKTVASAPRSGFETALQVPSEAYVQVQALDSDGAVIGHSKTVRG